MLGTNFSKKDYNLTSTYVPVSTSKQFVTSSDYFSRAVHVLVLFVNQAAV